MFKIARFEHITGFSDKDVKLPVRKTKGSAGYDFHMACDLTVMPGEEVTINTGVKCWINDGWFLSIYPRSSLGFKYKARLANTVGIIDSDYYNNESNEGQIIIKICNEGDKVIVLHKGDAFAQGIFLPYGMAYEDEINIVRRGGIGSTGE